MAGEHGADKEKALTIMDKTTRKKVEELLTEYPTLFKRIVLREEYITAMAFCFGEKVGQPQADLEDVIESRKAKDPEYNFLKNRIAWIKEAFTLLPAELKKLIALVYFHGLPLESVAAELGISEREFYRRKQQALEEIIKNLKRGKSRDGEIFG